MLQWQQICSYNEETQAAVTEHTRKAQDEKKETIQEEQCQHVKRRSEQTLNGNANKLRRDEDSPSPTESSNVDAETHRLKEAAAGAAEKRKAASLSRGIGDEVRAQELDEARQSSKAPPDDDLFGSSRKRQLREALTSPAPL